MFLLKILVGFQSGLPFIGFGFVDNFIMIVAVKHIFKASFRIKSHSLNLIIFVKRATLLKAALVSFYPFQQWQVNDSSV